MKPASFLSEQWMTQYEHQARINLTDSSADSLSFEQLANFEPDLLKNLVLDYGTIEGDLRLREKILSFYKDRNPRTLAISHGCSEGSRLVMEVLLEAGDHVITYVPGYQQFWEIPEKMGCQVTLIELNEKDWSLDIEKLEKSINKKTKLLILNNPANPTGASLSNSQMLKIVEICKKHHVWILCDEVYLYPDEDHPSFNDLYDQAIVTSSLSKTLGLPGLRIGWIKGPESVVSDITLARDYSLISTGPLIDTLGYIALKHRDEIRKPIEKVIGHNRQTVDEWIGLQKDFEWVKPENGSLGFMKIVPITDSADFCRRLLDQTGIFFVPGSCFGKEGYVRIGLGFIHENIQGSLDEVRDFLQEYLKQNPSTLQK
ncbi:aminotransferase class I/II-fold pyridoxal phosphate-dependent enzyme [Ileibacterium valens]|uniref:aminotransferase class I/II-fold pyridoxal phosphate-dependent enzyme n=1 Tax=Ileibacterium valens TaxID=1862668 RepID=UPI00272DC123|nr:aminotransferase class I/II-fold pyridoxal phosphate-dependent enzyme [Ileibacterium valens]